MIDRIKEILDKEQLTPARFADIINVQRSAVSHVLTGRNKPSLDFVTKILTAFPRLNTNWLLSGAQPMYISSETDSSISASSQAPEIPFFQTNGTDGSKNTQNEPVKSADFIPNIFDKQPIVEKKISNIIVFYNDGTFDSFVMEPKSR